MAVEQDLIYITSSYIRNVAVDVCLWKENLFGQSALLINATYIFSPNVIIKFTE